LTGTLTLSNNLTAIPNNAFNGDSGLTGSLVLPDSITSIGSMAFFSCGFTGELSLPENPNLTTLGTSAFANNNFSSIVIPNNIVTLGTQNFKDCNSCTLIICNYETAPNVSAALDAFSNLATSGTITNADPYYTSDELCTLFKTVGLPDG
jgi:hypothetical protein